MKFKKTIVSALIFSMIVPMNVYAGEILNTNANRYNPVNVQDTWYAVDYTRDRDYYNRYWYDRNTNTYYDTYYNTNYSINDPYYRYRNQAPYPYYRYYDNANNYSYRYTYNQVVNRSQSAYRTKTIGSERYYYFEETYYDRDNIRHFYYEEFYLDNNNNRVYYIEDYYLDSRDEKVYVLKERFNSKDYNNYPRNYYYRYYNNIPDYNYRYTYNQAVNRSQSAYRTKTIGSEKYYYFEETYFDRNDNRHYYYEEYYLDSNNNRVYYIEDYYYDSSNKKVYVLKERFNSKDYSNYPRNYNYPKSIDYSKDDFYTRFRNIQRKYAEVSQGQFVTPYTFIPAPLPIASEKWPKIGEFTVAKEDMAKALTDELFESNTSRYRPYYNIETIRGLMKKNYPYYYFSGSDRETTKYFLYFFGFVDDYMVRFGNSKKETEWYLNNLGDELFATYYAYYNGYITQDQITGMVQTTQKVQPTNYQKFIAENRLSDINERVVNNAYTLNERKMIDTGNRDITRNAAKKFPSSIVMSEGSSTMDRVFDEYPADLVEMGAPVYKQEGYYMVPAAMVGANLGIIVNYDPIERATYMEKGGVLVKFYNGSNTVFVNGVSYPLPTNSEVSNSRIMIPVNVLEHFGYRLGTDVQINFPNGVITINN